MIKPGAIAASQLVFQITFLIPFERFRAGYFNFKAPLAARIVSITVGCWGCHILINFPFTLFFLGESSEDSRETWFTYDLSLPPQPVLRDWRDVRNLYRHSDHRGPRNKNNLTVITTSTIIPGLCYSICYYRLGEPEPAEFGTL